MKLNRSQPHDVTDMIAIWPHICDVWPTPTDVEDAYYKAFLMEKHDPHLFAQVEDIARRAKAPPVS